MRPRFHPCAGQAVRMPSHSRTGLGVLRAVAQLMGPKVGLPNKRMNLTKPAQAMELRRLSSCWADI